MTNPFDISKSPITEPESIVAGSYVLWRKLLDYSDASFSLTYVLNPRGGGTTLTVAGTFDAQDEEWQFEVPSATSSGWASGVYRWDLNITRTSDGEIMCISTGEMQVFGSADDRRTHAEIMVQKIESLLSGRADSDIESYSIKSRSLSKMSVKELTDWRDYYRAEILRTGGSVTSAVRPKRNSLRVRWR